ncbi:PD40 domain-containing protein [Pseudanabaenaceae cyanobacterium LEGE 13415]|nr:PD40 domain-containing protein [Pseudanabaenaceae cyanobacterium LEGE 13415]
MSKITAEIVQNSRSLQKTVFSPRTAKFLFIVLLAFAIVLTSLSVQAAPKAIVYSNLSFNPNQSGLFSIQPTGRDRRKLVPGAIGAAVWSPNGQRIAFTLNDDVYVVNSNGSNLKKRFTEESACRASSTELHWFSDNQRLVFPRSCDGFTNEDPGTVSIFLSSDKVPTSQLWSPKPDQELNSNLAFSPNGQAVSYVANRSLYRMTLNNPGATQPITPADSEAGYQFSLVSWSPDSTKIARIDYLKGRNQRISIVQPDGKLLAQWTSPGINWATPNLIWSPNSEQVAYYQSEPKSLSSIYLFDLKTKTQKALTREPAYYTNLKWSPDGRQIAFTYQVDSARTALYTIDLASSILKDLTPNLKTEEIDAPAWSPDSRQIIFVSGKIGENNLYIVNRNGSGLRQLTYDRESSIYYPTWQP